MRGRDTACGTHRAAAAAGGGDVEVPDSHRSAGAWTLDRIRAGSGSGRRSATPRPGGGRYLRHIPSGLLRIDHTVIKREAHLDGKWLLGGRERSASSTDPQPEDLGRSSLLQVQPHPLASVPRVYHGAHLMVHDAGLHGWRR